MTALDTEAEDMAKKAAKTSPVRLTEEAMRKARIASGFTQESMTEYVSRIVVERAQQDIDRGYAEMHKEENKESARKGRARP